MDTKKVLSKDRTKQKQKEPVKKVETCAYSGLPSMEYYVKKAK